MKNNEVIVIRQVSNGFIVTPRETHAMGTIAVDESVKVFETLGALVQFLKVHFKERK